MNLEYQPRGRGPFVRRSELVPLQRQVLGADPHSLGTNPTTAWVKNDTGSPQQRGALLSISPLPSAVTEADRYQTEWSFSGGGTGQYRHSRYAVLSRALEPGEVDPTAVIAGGAWARLKGPTGRLWARPSMDDHQLEAQAGQAGSVLILHDPGPAGETRLARVLLRGPAPGDEEAQSGCGCPDVMGAVLPEQAVFGGHRLARRWRLCELAEVLQGHGEWSLEQAVLTWEAADPNRWRGTLWRTCYSGAEEYSLTMTEEPTGFRIQLWRSGDELCPDEIDWTWRTDTLWPQPTSAMPLRLDWAATKNHEDEGGDYIDPPVKCDWQLVPEAGTLCSDSYFGGVTIPAALRLELHWTPPYGGPAVEILRPRKVSDPFGPIINMLCGDYFGSRGSVELTQARSEVIIDSRVISSLGGGVKWRLLVSWYNSETGSRNTQEMRSAEIVFPAEEYVPVPVPGFGYILTQAGWDRVWQLLRSGIYFSNVNNPGWHSGMGTFTGMVWSAE